LYWNGIISETSAYWCFGLLFVAAVVAWFSRGSLWKTAVGLMLAFLAVVSLSLSGEGRLDIRAFKANVVSLLMIGFIVFWMVKMVLGPFRPDDKDKK
jgi:hypothetical protein